MIKATNNAKGISVVRRGDSVEFIGHFGNKKMSRVVVSLKALSKALKDFNETGGFDVSGQEGKIGIVTYITEPGEVRVYFPPIQHCDLIVVSTRGLMRVLKKIFAPSGVIIKARTEIGNIFQIVVDQDGVTMRRIRGADGKSVKKDVYCGDRLHFLDSRFVIRKGETIVGETFGKAVVTEITVS